LAFFNSSLDFSSSLSFSLARTLALAGLVLAALVTCAVAREDKDEKAKDKEKPKAKVYKTPQDVFDAAQKAQEDNDYKALVGCYTEKARGDRAVFFAAVFSEGRARLKDKDDEKSKEELKKAKPILDVLDKHGLTEEAVAKVKKDTEKDQDKAHKAVLDLIKDPTAFLVEFATEAHKAGVFGKPAGKVEKKLTDVKIDGDKATATEVTTRTIKGKDKDEDKKVEQKEPVTFVKVDGSWLIDEEGNLPTGKKKDRDKKKDQ